MSGTSQNGMQCAEFESLLADALDGLLTGEKQQSFEQHRSDCPVCGPMFAEAQAGLNWMQSLEEVEPPAHLVNRILHATVGQEGMAPVAVSKSWLQRLSEWAAPVLKPVLQPRFAMSFAMAFFSVSIMLDVAGLKVADLRPGMLRTSAIRGYYETTAKVVKYYENIRFVYQIESRVRELRKVTEPENSPKPEQEQKKKKMDNKTTGDPDKRYQNYSREQAGPTLAGSHSYQLWRQVRSREGRT